MVFWTISLPATKIFDCATGGPHHQANRICRNYRLGATVPALPGFL